MDIYKEFNFEAAHFLPNVPAEHKCRTMHGHSYKIRTYIRGKVNPDTGWVIDFNDLKTAVIPVIKELDHKILNEITGLENPTVENLAIWIWNKLSPHIPLLSKIEISETATSGCIYEGE